MKFTKRLFSILLVAVLLASILCTSVASAFAADTKATVNEYSEAAMALDDEYAYSGELGSFYTPDSTVFKVWAPTATKVELKLYATGSDDETGAADLGTFAMKKLLDDKSEFTGVWTTTVEADLKNVYYTYRVTSPKSILGGKSSTRETQDIYSKACGVNSNRSMVVDLDSTDPKGWENDKHIYVDNQSEAIVWELQVKDFSYSSSSGVSSENRGKYLAFTETGTTLNNEGSISTCVDYLKQLGITHVQINPFYDFGSIDECGDDSQFNWGYDPVNYGVPEGSFSSNPYDGNVRINECKQMIQALHNAGIGVIMDVVYNHTYSRSSPFNYIVPEYYYRIKADGSYSNQSGCSNDTASERAMYRKFMLDMVEYWTQEYHIDGYRFDLMGIHDCETMNLIRDMLDETDERIIIYGEGWSGNTAFDPLSCTDSPVVACIQGNADKVSDRIGFFNDQLRDALKGGVFDEASSPGFLSGAILYSTGISYGIRANTYGKGCNWDAKSPMQCVTYASCHDNLSLYDKLVAINYGASADYRVRYADVIAQNKFSSAITLSSQGINLMLAGEEMGRSKDGDENSYKSPATLNMIDWNLLQNNADLVSYYKGMIELRKAFSPFTASVSDAKDNNYNYYFSSSMATGSNVIMYTVDNFTQGEWDKVAVLFNGSDVDRNATLSTKIDKTLTEDMQWVVVADSNTAGTEKLYETSGLTFRVPANSAIIAVEKSTYEANTAEPKYSKVIVNHIYNETGEVIRQNTLLGRVGDTYSIEPDSTIPLKYELSSVEGDSTGVFTENDITVNYYYDRYIPSSFLVENGDVDGDSKISILDATAIQRHLAKLAILSDEQLNNADYNYDSKTTIIDATFVQRYLAKLDVAVCTLTVNHLNSENDKKIASPFTKEVRLGDEYTTQPRSNPFYVVGESPANASGIVSGNTTVDYRYVYTADTVSVHIKHSGELTFNPFLWVWADSEDGAQSVDCFSAWPGKELTECDENGWFNGTVDKPVGFIYNLIVNDGGASQTTNYEELTADEIWIVINDDEVSGSSPWISIYSDADLTQQIA